MIKKLSLLASLVLLPLATLSAKSKPAPDFLEFRGNYTGTTTLTVTTGSVTTVGGLVSIRVAVPGNGRSAVAKIAGSVTASGNVLPYSGTLKMTKSRLSGSDALFNLFSTTGPFTVPGNLSRNGFRALGTTTVNATPVIIQSTAKVKPRGKKKKTITITYVISASGVSYSYQFTGTGKAGKN
jgi:hypothetical protein